MRNPDIYSPSEFKDSPITFKDGIWIIARPLPFYGLRLFHNLKIAFAVFTGKYDALKWDGGQ
jgi:hypothetical protein